MTPIDILSNLIYLAVVFWVLILAYHALDAYSTTNTFCITKETVGKANDSVKTIFVKAKEYVIAQTKQEFGNKECLEEDIPTVGAQIQPEETKYDAPVPAPVIGEANDLQPNIKSEDEIAAEEDYTETLRTMAIGKSMIDKHEEYVKEADIGKVSATSFIEREPVDVIPWIGLRRVDYGAVKVSEGARTVPSTTDASKLPAPVDISKFLKW